jgi:hypothetical protein
VKFTKPLIAAATIAAAGSIGFVGAPVAFADPTTQNLGSQGKLEDGNVVQGWTVSNLKVSSDTIPHAVNGTLWEATATDQAIQGGATPIVSNFNARARNGDTYRVLFGAATPQGVNPATLAQGEKTTGKIYFDVTGAAPDSVVYNAGGQDLLTWVQAPASSGTGGGTGWRPSSTSGGSGATTSGTTGAAAATPAPAVGAETKPAQPAAVQGAPGTTATEGSQGTPLPAGSQGTPIADGTTAGTPVPAGTPAAAGTPVPAGSQGTPLPAQGQPIPAATEGGAPAAAAPASPAPAAAPTTTPTPVPPAR